MSDNIRANALEIKRLAQQLKDSLNTIHQMQEWLNEYLASLEQVCGSDHGGYREARTRIFYGQSTLLRDYRDWMTNAAQYIDEIGDRTMATML